MEGEEPPLDNLQRETVENLEVQDYIIDVVIDFPDGE